ncbi:MAG TPA: DUF63 family protein [Candidatus Thermoplasmatota archaeon]|nr:DUF63 family protein [Candidatus Thermoplasmatota archaeon]
MTLVADGPAAGFKRFYHKHSTLVWTLAVLLPVATLAVGLVVAKPVFYDHFIWEDIWGPTISDANQWRGACLQPDGSHVEAVTASNGRDLFCRTEGAVLANEGYTITSEITYGLVLAAALYAIYRQIFLRYRVPVDGWFVLGLLPYILLGPFGRVLEDANVFIDAETGLPVEPFAYMFISPWIYMSIAVFTIMGLLLGIFLARRRETLPAHLAAATMGAYLALLVSGYALLYNRKLDEFGALPRPAWVAGASLLALVAYYLYTRRKGTSLNLTLFTAGVPLATPALVLVGRWIFTQDRWPAPEAWRGATYVNAGLVMLGIAAAITVAVYLLGKLLTRKFEWAQPYTNLFNLALVFGHMMDGFATYLAIKDPLNLGLGGYGEKHPVSNVLLDYLGGALFPLVKFLMIITVIYLMDREFQKDQETDRNLVGLVKMAIFVLGFAPGLRDVLRVMMGL